MTAADPVRRTLDARQPTNDAASSLPYGFGLAGFFFGGPSKATRPAADSMGC